MSACVRFAGRAGAPGQTGGGRGTRGGEEGISITTWSRIISVGLGVYSIVSVVLTTISIIEKSVFTKVRASALPGLDIQTT